MRRISSLLLIPAVIAGGLSYRIASSGLENLSQKQPIPVVKTIEKPSSAPVRKGDIYAVIATGYERNNSYAESIKNAVTAERALKQKGAKNIEVFLDNPAKLPVPKDISVKNSTAEKVFKAIENLQSTNKDDVYLIFTGDGVDNYSAITFSDESTLDSRRLREIISEKKHCRLFVVIESYLAGSYGAGQQRLENAFYVSFDDSRYFGKFLGKFSEGSSMWDSFKCVKEESQSNPSSLGAFIFDEKGEKWRYPVLPENTFSSDFAGCVKQFSQKKETRFTGE